MDADIAFEHPSDFRKPPGRYGLLHLLRRDIIQCMGRNPTTNETIPFMALWPAAMAIFAGIDLLAKYHAGNDASRESSQRFKKFVSEYFPLLAPGDETVIYQLRNSIMHSFGLYAKTNTQIYHFEISIDHGPLINRLKDDRYVINLTALHNDFEKAVERFQEAVDTDSILQQHFTDMFSIYGSLNYRGRA